MTTLERAEPARSGLLGLLFLLTVSGGSFVDRSLALAAPGRAPIVVRDVRVGATPERTRLVLELSGALPSFESSAHGDTALVLLLPALRPPTSKLSTPQGRLRRFEATATPAANGSGQDLMVRIVFTAPSEVEVFALPSPDRIVVDLFARGAAASRGESDPRAKPITTTPAAPSAADGPRVVVIDPGHGGEDPGATGGALEEKAITLDVARRLADVLRADAGLRPHLTRDDDRRIPLRKRMRTAEEKDADLFVSIHVNASTSRAAAGAEVFFLSLGAASDEAASEAARLENEADPEYVMEEDASLEGIPFSVQLRQADTLRRSSRAAERVLDAMGDRKLAEVRGVKQAGFAVLKSFQVPSILVEVGFISSATDRKKLADPEHRQRLAEAIAAGVRDYLLHDAPHRASVPR